MSLNILIVDDSSLIRKKIRRIIKMAQLDVTQFFEAPNGSDALKILDEVAVDLVLADLNMPVMSGAEMIHRMKADEATKSIPVVVVSTESRTNRIKFLLAEGIKDYLHKPFTPEQFKELICGLWDKNTEQAVDLLTDALSHTLETMAFLTIIPVDEDMVTPEETILAEISFTGPKSGTIQILAGTGLGKTLAKNIAGVSDMTTQGACDALKELANVICGLFLPMVVSSTADMFDITIPNAKVCEDPQQWSNFTADQDSRILNIEGCATAVKLTIEGE